MTGPGPNADGTIMRAFEGLQVPEPVRSALADHDVAGFTLFRHLNVESPGQVRALTASLQQARGAGRPPLLVAADQEGGQLIGLGEQTTPFAGNMALGATTDPGLAERVGGAIGRELRALGVNVDYAPVCDVATNPANPSLGVRAFGDDPQQAGALAAAFVRGLQAEGVAATAKHFPGKGEAVTDPHHELPLLDLDLDHLDTIELVPFRAAVRAGARMVMVGHYALPRITGSDELPSSMSSHIVREVLRDRLGFDGVAITDALDMRALRQGAEQAEVVVAAMRAGIDLLLCTADSAQQDRVRTALGQAVATGELDPERVASATHRVRGLRTWVAPFRQPPLEVVGCGEHRSLARELAERAVTLVRDLDGLLPLRLGPDAHVAAVMPRPRDLTPADTSSRVRPALAPALRTRHPRVEEILTSNPPSAGEIAAVRDRLGSFDLAVVGTMDAFRDPRQADLVRAVLGVAVSAVWVALRTPFDLAVVPEARAYACTFGILPPSVEALAAAMFGEIPFPGRLPAAIPGLYPAGSGLPT